MTTTSETDAFDQRLLKLMTVVEKVTENHSQQSSQHQAEIRRTQEALERTQNALARLTEMVEKHAQNVTHLLGEHGKFEERFLAMGQHKESSRALAEKQHRTELAMERLKTLPGKVEELDALATSLQTQIDKLEVSQDTGWEHQKNIQSANHRWVDKLFQWVIPIIAVLVGAGLSLLSGAAKLT